MWRGRGVGRLGGGGEGGGGVEVSGEGETEWGMVGLLPWWCHGFAMLWRGGGWLRFGAWFGVWWVYGGSHPGGYKG